MARKPPGGESLSEWDRRAEDRKKAEYWNTPFEEVEVPEREGKPQSSGTERFLARAGKLIGSLRRLGRSRRVEAIHDDPVQPVQPAAEATPNVATPRNEINRAEDAAHDLALQLAKQERLNKRIDEELRAQLAETQGIQATFERQPGAPIYTDAKGNVMEPNLNPEIVGNPNPEFVEPVEEDRDIWEVPDQYVPPGAQAEAAPVAAQQTPEAPAALAEVVAEEAGEMSGEQKQNSDLAKIIRRVNPLREGNEAVAALLESPNMDTKDAKRVMEAIANLRPMSSSWGKDNLQLFDDVEQRLNAEMKAARAEKRATNKAARQEMYAEKSAGIEQAQKDKIAAKAARIGERLSAKSKAEMEARQADKQETIAAFDGLSQVFDTYKAMHPARFSELAKAFSRSQIVPEAYAKARLQDLPRFGFELQIDDASLEAGRAAAAELKPIAQDSKEFSAALERGLSRIDSELNRRREQREKQAGTMAESEQAYQAHQAKIDAEQSERAAIQAAREEQELAERQAAEHKVREAALYKQAMEDTAKIFEQYRSLHPARHDDLAEAFAGGAPDQKDTRKGLRLIKELLGVQSLSDQNRKTLDNAQARIETALAEPPAVETSQEAVASATPKVREFKRPDKLKSRVSRRYKQPKTKAA